VGLEPGRAASGGGEFDSRRGFGFD